MEQMPRLTRIRHLQLKGKPGGAGDVEVQLALTIYSSEG
jgi:hypothetical protein